MPNFTYIGKLHRCGEDDPQETGEYFVFVFDSQTGEIEHLHEFSFVVGYGWNCHENFDGTVSNASVMDLSGERHGSVHYWMEGELYEKCN